MYPEARKTINSIIPYKAGMSKSSLVSEKLNNPLIKLSSNENPYGPSDNVARLLSELDVDILSRYPDGSKLVSSIAKQTGVSLDNIMIGNGSNELIDLLAIAYLNPLDESIIPEYSFIAYELAVKKAGGKIIETRSPNYTVSVENIIRRMSPSVKIIWLANPNNPTGTLITQNEVINLLDHTPMDTLVVLDEAYIEYVDASYDNTELIGSYNNLVILRTFSKAYGLAGTRVGYAISNPNIIEVLNKVRSPFNVSSISLALAESAMLDQNYITTTVSRNNHNKKELQKMLSKLNIRVVGSQGNFITIETEYADKLFEILLSKNIILRPLKNYQMDNCLRITVGTESEIKTLCYELELFFCKSVE